MPQFTGRLNVIDLAGQTVMKQNMAVRRNKSTIRGINWIGIGSSESRDGLHGALSTGSRFLISYLGVRHVVPDARAEKPTLSINGRMFVPQSIKLKGMYEPMGQELVDFPWTAKNYPPQKFDPLFAGEKNGIILMESDEAGMMIDLALVVSFSRIRQQGRYPIHFGIPLGCPVETHRTRGKNSIMYFLFAPRCGETEFSAWIPATRRVFPKLPGRMHMALGLARARLKYDRRLETYMTKSFYAVKLLNFPTLNLRDLKRISI